MSTDRAGIAHSIAQVAFSGTQNKRLIDVYWSEVPAHLFNDQGKWKYEVALNYTNPPEGYIAPHNNALRAMRQATEQGTSGVTMHAPEPGWLLVVFEPPEGYPVMARGEDAA